MAKKIEKQLNKYKKMNTSNIRRKHKVLLLAPRETDAQYQLPFIEEIFKAGVLVEICGFEAFVDNADAWRYEFDILVLTNSLYYVPYICKVTPSDIKNKIANMMEAGVKLLWFVGPNSFSIRKYGPDGVVDTSLTVNASDLLDGLYRGGRNIISDSTYFQKSIDYPFGELEILRPGVIPKQASINNFIAYDNGETIFPIQAVDGETVANCTAYKPGKFFIVSYAGYTSGAEDSGVALESSAYYKYLYGHELINILLGKESNVRLAIDAQEGRRIAAVGVDGDCTDEFDAILPIAKAFKGKPLEIGLVANKVTAEVAGFYKNLTERENYEIVSHTYTHYFGSEFQEEVTETHVIGSRQIIQLKRAFRAVIQSVTINGSSLTLCTGNLNTGKPTASEYSATLEDNRVVGGYLKFHADNIGEEVTITYRTSDERLEVFGSLDKLEEMGCLTLPVVYLTGGHYSYSPAIWQMADRKGVILCAYEYFPGYSTDYTAIVRSRRKRPPTVGTIMKPGWNRAMVDAQIFNRVSKEGFKNTFLPAAISRCEEMELPFMFYIHDFPFSETHAASIWLSSSYDPDWKQETIEETRTYTQEAYEYMVEQFDNANVYWMTRGQYVDRYNYLNSYLIYDVEDTDSRTLIYVKNGGDKRIDGLTFRVPISSEPANVELSNGENVRYSYAGNLLTLWFDVLPGERLTVNIEL